MLEGKRLQVAECSVGCRVRAGWLVWFPSLIRYHSLLDVDVFEVVHPPEARLAKGHAEVWVPLASCGLGCSVRQSIQSAQRWTLFACQMAIGNHGKRKHGEYASVLFIAVS